MISGRSLKASPNRWVKPGGRIKSTSIKTALVYKLANAPVNNDE